MWRPLMGAQTTALSGFGYVRSKDARPLVGQAAKGGWGVLGCPTCVLSLQPPLTAGALKDSLLSIVQRELTLFMPLECTEIFVF